MRAAFRVLAVDPTTRGFGFAVFEGPERIIDWAVANVRTDKRTGCLRRVAGLLDRYHPDVFVVEKADGSRRCARVRELLPELAELASSRGIKVRAFTRQAIRKTFTPTGAVTKPQIAAVIAARFPELARHLPAPRKAWMSEDEGMSVFDAAELALAYYGLPSATNTIS